MRWRILGALAAAGVASGVWACGGQTNLTTAPTGCAAVLSPLSQNAPAGGGNFAVSITVGQGCEWTATTSEGWVTLMRGSGAGSGSAAYTIAPNTTGDGRSGRIRIGDESIAITQSPAECTFTLDPPSATVPASGGTVEIRLGTKDGCTWSASASDSWLALPVTSGAGPRTIPVTVQANTTNAQRVASITAGGQMVAISQDSPSQTPACAVTLSGRTFSVAAAGGTVDIGVTIGPGCSWRTQGLPDWVQTDLESSSSSGRPVFTVAANTSRSARAATFRIADQPVTITQAGVGCSYSVSPAAQNVADSGGTVHFTVTAGPGCEWSASSGDGWLRASPASGSGNGSVAVTAAANTAASRRSGAVQIADRSVRVEQNPAPCRYSLGSSSTNVGVDGGTVTFSVETLDGCGWKATTSEGWIQIASGSGSRSGTVSATVGAHSSSAERRGTISVEGRTFTVTQAPCTYRGTWLSVATSGKGRIEEPMAAAASGDTLVVTIETGRECRWKHSEAPAWIPGITPSEYTGRADIKLPVACNTTKLERRGSMSIAGREVGIVQPFDPTGRCVR